MSRLDEIGLEAAFGVRIYFNPACLKETKEPLRVYRRRRWQTAAQAERKQKKWAKRWGRRSVPCAFSTPSGLFLHPSFRNDLEAISRELTIIEAARRGPRLVSSMVSA